MHLSSTNFVHLITRYVLLGFEPCLVLQKEKDMHWAVSTRQLSLIIALGIHLSLIGCSAKKSAHTVESQDAAKVTPSSDGGLDPLERSRLLRKTRASSESPSTPDYRTAFRAVLSAGYRVRPKNLETVSVKQCQSAFNSLLTQPDVVLPFLTKN